MPSSPNTPAVLTAIKNFALGATIAGASSPFFPTANVKIGRFADIRDNVPAFEVVLGPKDESKRYTVAGAPIQGGQIDDSQNFTWEVTLQYEGVDTTEVELVTLPGIRDALTQLFHASAQLGLPGQVGSSRLSGGDGEYGYVERNGALFRYYKNILHVRYEYYVTMVP